MVIIIITNIVNVLLNQPKSNQLFISADYIDIIAHNKVSISSYM
jgi:hypothetical protein